MNTLLIDRSTEVQSVAWATGETVVERSLEGIDCRSGAWALKVRDFIAEQGGGAAPDRIVVGTGPGSFAGIRAALAFAQGYAIGSGCAVLGLPSPCACAPTEGPSAVVGDARRGLFWLALFDGTRLVRPIFQVVQEELEACIPQSAPVVSPDDVRIGGVLKELFAARYKGLCRPTAGALARYAVREPAMLKPEPLPLYLNPAVR
ncbi:MAG: tRNA (adenosine(37)-N6)-threonylcarbamoyltransferase complex dimerization subunit type 1 TsaB [Kiritimatiellia bacterium]